MTFKEFSKALREDPRAMELLNRCSPDCKPLNEKETEELVQRSWEACARAERQAERE